MRRKLCEFAANSNARRAQQRRTLMSEALATGRKDYLADALHLVSLPKSREESASVWKTGLVFFIINWELTAENAEGECVKLE